MRFDPTLMSAAASMGNQSPLQQALSRAKQIGNVFAMPLQNERNKAALLNQQQRNIALQQRNAVYHKTGLAQALASLYQMRSNKSRTDSLTQGQNQQNLFHQMHPNSYYGNKNINMADYLDSQAATRPNQPPPGVGIGQLTNQVPTGLNQQSPQFQGLSAQMAQRIPSQMPGQQQQQQASQGIGGLTGMEQQQQASPGRAYIQNLQAQVKARRQLAMAQAQKAQQAVSTLGVDQKNINKERRILGAVTMGDGSKLPGSVIDSIVAEGKNSGNPMADIASRYGISNDQYNAAAKNPLPKIESATRVRGATRRGGNASSNAIAEVRSAIMPTTNRTYFGGTTTAKVDLNTGSLTERAKRFFMDKDNLKKFYSVQNGNSNLKDAVYKMHQVNTLILPALQNHAILSLLAQDNVRITQGGKIELGKTDVGNLSELAGWKTANNSDRSLAISVLQRLRNMFVKRLDAGVKTGSYQDSTNATAKESRDEIKKIYWDLIYRKRLLKNDR